VPRRVDVIDPGRWLAGTRGAADAAGRPAAGMALETGTMAPPGDRTMAPPRVAAGAAFLAAAFAAFFFGLAGSLATGRLGPPFTPRVFSKRVTRPFAAPIVRESPYGLSFSIRRLRDNSLYLVFAALAGAFDVRAGLAAGAAAAGVAFLALGFRAGFSTGAAAGLTAAFFALGLAAAVPAFFAGFPSPATGRLVPPFTPLVFVNRVTAPLAAPAARALLHMLPSLAAALAFPLNSLYLSFAALTGAFGVRPAAAVLALVAMVALVVLLAAVSDRLLRTVPEEANRPRASRFNCLAMPTPVLFL
jgi:hypothetical protein